MTEQIRYQKCGVPLHADWNQNLHTQAKPWKIVLSVLQAPLNTDERNRRINEHLLCENLKAYP